jgi:hypothetical protein
MVDCCLTHRIHHRFWSKYHDLIDKARSVSGGAVEGLIIIQTWRKLRLRSPARASSTISSRDDPTIVTSSQNRQRLEFQEHVAAMI